MSEMSRQAAALELTASELYPAAVGRGRPNGDQRGLVRGIKPIGWMADVAYVPSSENRSHGSSLGAKLRPFCDGTKFQYAFKLQSRRAALGYAAE